MFNFGLFSTHIPYLIMVLLYVVYYISTLLGGNVSLTEKETKNTSQTLSYEISFQTAPKKNISTYQASFKQCTLQPKKTKSKKPQYYSTKKERMLVLPVFEEGYSFSLFSRPPPSFNIA